MNSKGKTVETTKGPETTTPGAFHLSCPRCGTPERDDEGGSVRIDLSDLVLYCPQCELEITRESLRRGIDERIRLLRWLDLAVTLLETPAAATVGRVAECADAG